MIYCEPGNSGVETSIVGMGRHEYLKSMLRFLTPLKTKDSEDACKRMYEHFTGVEKDLLSE